MNCELLPQSESIKYLSIQLDTGLTWRINIFNRRKQIEHILRKMYGLIRSRSKPSLNYKLLIYKAAPKPVWTYGLQLWGTASNSHIALLERFQSKVLRAICNAFWFIPNKEIHQDLHINIVKEEMIKRSVQYLNELENLNAMYNIFVYCIVQVANRNKFTVKKLWKSKR